MTYLPHSRIRPVGLILVAVAILALLALSPLLLLGLDAAFNVDWARLSEIGQSYTAAATFLSAVALLGIVQSMRLQARQTAILQGQTTRQFQFELLRLAMSDPLYASVLASNGETEGAHDDFRLRVFITQWLRYFQFSYLSGELTESALVYVLEHEIFSAPAGREWWNRARPVWIAEAESGRNEERRFVKVIERAFIRASASASHAPSHDAR